MTIPPDAIYYLRATGMLIAIWSTITALEWLTLRAQFGRDGLLRPVRRFDRYDRLRGWVNSRTVTFIAVARLAAAGVLLVSSSPDLLALGFAITALTAPLIALTTDHYDGSDKMGLIVSVAGALAATGVAIDDAWLAFAGVLLAAGQLTISYCVAGVSKLLIPEWRSGRALIDVMHRDGHGHPVIRTLLALPGASRMFCWPFLLGEALFPATLFAPPVVLAAALCLFALFHLATGWLMGLNTFAWAFVAAYPAVWLLATAIRAST